MNLMLYGYIDFIKGISRICSFKKKSCDGADIIIYECEIYYLLKSNQIKYLKKTHKNSNIISFASIFHFIEILISSDQ